MNFKTFGDLGFATSAPILFYRQQYLYLAADLFLSKCSCLLLIQPRNS
uniref:Uncharacterized protein n=1 Tax=Arundo donax TaxID=35708 RepID=A0A0A8Y1M9_ARUDO